MPAPLAHVNDLANRLVDLSDPVLVPFLKDVLRDGLGATPATAFHDASQNASRTLLNVVLHRDLTAGLGHLVLAFPPQLYRESWNRALDACVTFHQEDYADRTETVWEVVYPAAIKLQTMDPILGLLNLAKDVGKAPEELRLELHHQMGQAIALAARDLERHRVNRSLNDAPVLQAYRHTVAFTQALDARLDQVLGVTVDPESRFLNGIMKAACRVNDRDLARPLIDLLPTFPEGATYLERFFAHAVANSATAVLPGLLDQARAMAPLPTRSTHPYGVEITRQVKALVKEGALPYSSTPAPAASVTFLRQHVGAPISPAVSTAPRRARR